MVLRCLTFILHYTHYLSYCSYSPAGRSDEQGRLCWWPPPPHQDTKINLCPRITANMEIKSITLE